MFTNSEPAPMATGSSPDSRMGGGRGLLFGAVGLLMGLDSG
jgi:hypothetical protein